MSRAAWLAGALPLPLRSARMSVLGRALRRTDLRFPLELEFPGDADHGRTQAAFRDRTALERTLTDAQVNAINDGLAIFTQPDGGFLLAEKRAPMDAWRDQVPRRRSWLRGDSSSAAVAGFAARARAYLSKNWRR